MQAMASFCDGGGARTYASGTSVSSAASAMPAEAVPLLPSAEAPHDEWALAFPTAQLPAMPERTSAYWHEPCCGVCLVSVLSFMFCYTTISTAVNFIADQSTAVVLVLGILLSAAIAAGSTFYLLFGKAGELKRSHAACYPVPEEVAKRLLEGRKDMSGLSNIRSAADGRTYCVRCFLWRPSETSDFKCHHCNTCQRCVTGFDHHCGVFGRCIVASNMPCFVALIAMLFCGMIVTGASFVLAPEDMYEDSQVDMQVEVRGRGFMAANTPVPQWSPANVVTTTVGLLPYGAGP